MNPFLSLQLLSRRTTTVLIIVLLCSGCLPVPVPIFSRTPYPAELLQRLSARDADKNLVRRAMGPPAAVRDGGRYWFYASSREVLGVIGTDAVFEKFEWLAIEFDDRQRVVFLEHNDGRSGCLSNGICQLAGLFGTAPSTAVITAPRVREAEAKLHLPRADECAIYLYLEKLPPLAMAWVTFSVDGRIQGILDDKTFLFLTHPRGNIAIGAYQFKVNATCRGGERLYVKAVKAMDWSADTGKELTPVDAAAGEAVIRARRLALPD